MSKKKTMTDQAAADLLPVGEAARELGVPTRRVSDAIYRGWVDRDRLRLIGNRWLIPVGYLETMRAILCR